ncbi:MAG TPA: glycosyltransferase family 4 protein [Anaerolineales bacterium]|nr:glycosyltransferase family 4 protein [Anaerolineales bacterium]
MRVLIIHMRYLPDLTGTGPLVAELAADLARLGEQVTVITSMPHYGRLPSGGRPPRQAVEDGVRVIRTPAFPYASGTVAGRALDYVLCALASAYDGRRSPKADVVLAVAPPLTAGLSAWVAARGAPLVFNAQDIWPDGLVSMGKLRGALPIRAAHALERLTYGSAQKVTVLSDGMKNNLVAKGLPPSKVAVIPNWVDLEVVRPMDKGTALRRELGLEGSFIVLFAGNLGFAAGLETVVTAAECLRHEPNLAFLIVGEGSAKAGLMAHAQALGLSHLRFVTTQPSRRLAEVLATADISLVPLRRGMGALSVPSKAMAIMASARPVLAAVPPDSEVRRVVEEAQAGRCVAPEDPGAMAAEILRMRGEPERLQSFGANGRRYAEEHFGRAAIVARIHTLLGQVAVGRAEG